MTASDAPSGSLRPDRGESLDRMAATFSAIGAAVDYGYSSDAALNAAAANLGGLDRAELLAVAAMLASLVATDLQPRIGREAISAWAGRHEFLLAMMDRTS